ncbi:MAG: DUF2124 family protein [Methanobrevibacter sp.]|nr:DUF2124 family protein [Methanobrevibacter sp.]
MEDIENWKGINGQIVAFKNAVGDAQKITFMGSPSVCTPFAALMAYAVRDKENHFISFIDVETCHEFELKPWGMSLKEDVSDPHDSDVVVLLGGLSMPKADVGTDELNSVVGKILKDDGKLVGLCFMDMFTKAGWLEKVDFDLIIDGTLTGVVKK